VEKATINNRIKMSKNLGSNFGTNSIGWAIVDTEKKEIIENIQKSIDEVCKRGNNAKIKKKNIDILYRLDKVYELVHENIIILIFSFLQIITLYLNKHS
jgi:hypothetical protein